MSVLVCLLFGEGVFVCIKYCWDICMMYSRVVCLYGMLACTRMMWKVGLYKTYCIMVDVCCNVCRSLQYVHMYLM